jgi:hypothetical protein
VTIKSVLQKEKVKEKIEKIAKTVYSAIEQTVLLI